MIYFHPHIQALQAQIADLKDRLIKAELEARAAVEAGHRREDAVSERLTKAEDAARLREDALLERLAKAEEAGRLRADALLDRILAKNNVSPVAELLIPAAAPEIIAPYGTMGADVQIAMKESFLQEETQYIMSQIGCDEGTARAYAEQEYVARYQAIK